MTRELLNVVLSQRRHAGLSLDRKTPPTSAAAINHFHCPRHRPLCSVAWRRGGVISTYCGRVRFGVTGSGGMYPCGETADTRMIGRIDPLLLGPVPQVLGANEEDLFLINDWWWGGMIDIEERLYGWETVSQVFIFGVWYSHKFHRNISYQVQSFTSQKSISPFLIRKMNFCHSLIALTLTDEKSGFHFENLKIKSASSQPPGTCCGELKFSFFVPF